MSATTTDQEPATSGQRKPKSVVLESVAVLLLSVATVGTAWCSYEAASWGAVAQKYSGLAGGASRNSSLARLQAQQAAVLDILLFSQYINARAGSNQALSQFYSDRFRSEAKTAFDAWQATRPFENPNAPPHPFVTNFYQPRLLSDAAKADEESQRWGDKAGDAGRMSRNYILITVLLASALFCGGTAPKFEAPTIRRIVLVLGFAAFVFAIARLLLLPVAL